MKNINDIKINIQGLVAEYLDLYHSEDNNKKDKMRQIVIKIRKLLIEKRRLQGNG